MPSRAEREISRADKGVRVVIHPDYVVKHYFTEPAHISAAEQEKRFKQELEIYKRLQDLDCPFTPRLLAFSLAEKKFYITRIEGEDLLSLALRNAPIDIKSIISQLDEINAWLRARRFPDMGNNCKDMILDSHGRIYLIDFECDFSTRRPDLYNAVACDLAQRILRIKGKQGTPTPQLRRLFLAVARERPATTLKYLAYYFLYRLVSSFRPTR